MSDFAGFIIICFVVLLNVVGYCDDAVTVYVCVCVSKYYTTTILHNDNI